MIVITARGVFIEEMKDDAIRLLNENNIKFDKYYWQVSDKLEICKNEKVISKAVTHVMILPVPQPFLFN